jgi:hypothetical protein
MARQTRYARISSDSDDETQSNRVQKVLWAKFESFRLSSRCGAYTVMLIYLLSLLSAGAGDSFGVDRQINHSPDPRKHYRMAWNGLVRISLFSKWICRAHYRPPLEPSGNLRTMFQYEKKFAVYEPDESEELWALLFPRT